jgi:hypothetical protein
MRFAIEIMSVFCMGKVSRRIRIMSGIAGLIASLGYVSSYSGLSSLLDVYRFSMTVLLEHIRNPSANLTEYWNGLHISDDVMYVVQSQYQQIYGIMQWILIGLAIFGIGLAMIVIVAMEELKEKIDKLEAKLSQQTAPER